MRADNVCSGRGDGDTGQRGSYFIGGARREPMRDVAGVSLLGESLFGPLLRQDVASPASNQAPSILRDPSSGYANIAAVSGLQRGDGEEGGHEHSVTSQTHVAGGALFTAAGLGAANAAGWMHTPVWALAVGIGWGAIAGELADIDHPKARVSRTGVAFGVAGRVLGLPARIVGVFVRGLRVTHRGPTHSLTFLALWAAIAAPLYLAAGGVVLVALAWVVGKLAPVSHTGAHLNAQPAVRFLRAHLAVVYPYAVAATALGYLSHLVLDSLTGPIPWGWPFAHRRVALAPAALRIRTGSFIETWLVRPAITIAAILMFLEVVGIPSHPR